jgi:hypothetical protein
LGRRLLRGVVASRRVVGRPDVRTLIETVTPFDKKVLITFAVIVWVIVVIVLLGANGQLGYPR